MVFCGVDPAGRGKAGLTEIEAFSADSQGTYPFVKLTDSEGNFLYDYWTATDGVETLALYTVGYAAEEWTLTCTGEDCQAVLEQGKITVTCPKGSSCTVTVTNPDGTVSDRIVLRNPGDFTRKSVAWLQRFEQRSINNFKDTVTSRILFWAEKKLARMWP